MDGLIPPPDTDSLTPEDVRAWARKTLGREPREWEMRLLLDQLEDDKETP